jgi:signal transduction histidine kinase
VTIENTPFKTRARTIDHLGREQIADCPTAISELWKNSYDAYAKSVELNIFDASDDKLPVAALVDDGHGMSKDEFIEKWLVVGTESKATGIKTEKEDLNGLNPRPKQGQKGIGRLSCAAMGSLLLLVSKRRASQFVASLIDWRIFENPYLILNDIQLPVIEFEKKEELIRYLPEMFDSLLSNVWGSGKDEEKDRNSRIALAWEAYEEFQLSNGFTSTKSAIADTIIDSSFESRHFDKWPVWSNKSDHGTALFISQLSDDLLSQLSNESNNNSDTLVSVTRKKLFETLSGFIDPYIRENDSSIISNFTAAVYVWHGPIVEVVLDKQAQFNIKNLDQLEHFVEGAVDDDGVFRGKIRIFGKEIPNIVLPPREPLSQGPTSRVGSFLIRFGTFELKIGSTTHTDQQHAALMEATDKYGGFMLHRDGFRIMPYGREDNDYFEIEKRRLKNAGDYFWSARRTFGGVKITRENNPNLRDKAGREGIIENKAAKQFKRLVTNILEDIGRKHFGRHSQNRQEILPQVEADRARIKAAEDRKKHINRERKELSRKINENSDRLLSVSERLEALIKDLNNTHILNSKDAAIEVQKSLSSLSGEIKELDIGSGISSLGSLESEFLDYTKQYKKIAALQNQVGMSINIALEKLFTEAPENIFKEERDRKFNLINKRIQKWEMDARNELDKEASRLKELTKGRVVAYLEATEGLVGKIADGELLLSSGLNLLDDIYKSQSRNNEEIFPPYIGALQSLRDQIDLQGLTSFSVKESEALREEIGRIHALAQLGITVEVIGHEIQGLDMTIERSLEEMPADVKKLESFRSVQTAHHALSEKWRFLSPLKLSGEKIYRNISGVDIEKYIKKFFGDYIDRSIEFNVTDSFKQFSVNDLESRIYPVFVNLFNNARYWVRHTQEAQKKIVIDFVDGKVIVADNGPGVDEDDLSQLFTLFFTKKASGGRGVGLYLCKSNLAAGGHNIFYESKEHNKLLSGANFVIEFRGGKNG